MPLTCVAYNCTNRHQKGCGISFHRFPTNEALRQKWIEAVNRANWKPTHSSYLCSRHFHETCFRRINDRNYLLENSVPHRFDFTDHFSKTKHLKQLATTTKLSVLKPNFNCIKQLIPKETSCDVTTADHAYIFPPEQHMKKRVDESKHTIERLRRQLKMAQQKVRREKEKCARLRRQLGEAQRKVATSPCKDPMLENGFSEVMRDLCSRNTKHGVQYTEAVKDFALTLSGYSINAYEFLRKHINLPHYHTLRRWIGGPEGEDGLRKVTEEHIAEEEDEEGMQTVNEFDSVNEETML